MRRHAWVARTTAAAQASPWRHGHPAPIRARRPEDKTEVGVFGMPEFAHGTTPTSLAEAAFRPVYVTRCHPQARAVAQCAKTLAHVTLDRCGFSSAPRARLARQQCGTRGRARCPANTPLSTLRTRARCLPQVHSVEHAQRRRRVDKAPHCRHVAGGVGWGNGLPFRGLGTPGRSGGGRGVGWGGLASWPSSLP